MWPFGRKTKARSTALVQQKSNEVIERLDAAIGECQSGEVHYAASFEMANIFMGRDPASKHDPFQFDDLAARVDNLRAQGKAEHIMGYLRDHGFQRKPQNALILAALHLFMTKGQEAGRQGPIKQKAYDLNDIMCKSYDPI